MRIPPSLTADDDVDLREKDSLVIQVTEEL